MNKLQKACVRFRKEEALFKCPLCHRDFQVTEAGSFLCRSSHCFDISKKGYVNFSPSKQDAHYSRELFENRRQLFHGNFYGPVLSILREEILSYKNTVSASCLRLLDVGCGEGYYSNALSWDPSLSCFLRVFGVDLSKDAIQLAASSSYSGSGPTDQQASCQACFLIGDLANLPFQDHSIDVLLDILTPANYGEFKRVLKKDGILIKIIPGSGYLAEIRTLLSGQLVNQTYSNQKVRDHLEKHLSISTHKRLRYTRPVAREQAPSFFSMTPLTFDLDQKALKTEALKEITIDFEIITGRFS